MRAHRSRRVSLARSFVAAARRTARPHLELTVTGRKRKTESSSPCCGLEHVAKIVYFPAVMRHRARNGCSASTTTSTNDTLNCTNMHPNLLHSLPVSCEMRRGSLKFPRFHRNSTTRTQMTLHLRLSPQRTRSVPTWVRTRMRLVAIGGKPNQRTVCYRRTV